MPHHSTGDSLDCRRIVISRCTHGFEFQNLITDLRDGTRVGIGQQGTKFSRQRSLLFRGRFAPEPAGRQRSHALKIHIRDNFGLNNFDDALLVASLNLLIGLG
jgi:hypothetical protein